MLHVFSINRAKLVARKPKMTDKLRQREYCLLPARDHMLEVNRPGPPSLVV
jgi:hypothetical protein